MFVIVGRMLLLLFTNYDYALAAAVLSILLLKRVCREEAAADGQTGSSTHSYHSSYHTQFVTITCNCLNRVLLICNSADVAF